MSTECPGPEEGRAPAWRILVLGSLQAHQDDRVVAHFSWQKAESLLGYLAVNPGRSHPRERLIDLLWPDADLEAGRQNLNQALATLRRRLASGAPLFISDRASVSLNALSCVTDMAEFESALGDAATAGTGPERIAALRRGLALYRGELLEGLYDEWIESHRERLAQQRVWALQSLAVGLEVAGEVRDALEAAREALDADPLHEGMHQAVMRLTAAQGQPTTTRRHYEVMKRLWQEELGMEPSSESRQLATDAALTSGASTFAALTAEPMAPPSGHVPAPLTGLIGRQDELDQIHRLLHSTARLLTLRGPGGSGKTRLAIEAAERAGPDYRHRAWWVELAPVTSEQLILPGIARAVGAGSRSDRPHEDTLIDFLRSRHLLLVLDNCEHLLPACGTLAQRLLLACPNLRILATSRAPLGVAGEHLVWVPPLAVPPSDTLRVQQTTARPGATRESSRPEWELLERHDAARLFLDRARAVLPSFALDASNAAAVTEVCRRLDGLPLAIELAAARVQSLSVPDIARLLAVRSSLLATGTVASARHQTLQACIAWSYDLLSEPEKAVFRQLSRFAGGWTAEAVEFMIATVDGASSEPDQEPRGVRGTPFSDLPAREGDAPAEVMGLLVSLANTSLVEFDPVRGRYRMLETVREFAAERLEEAGESERASERHMEYFLGLSEAAESHSQDMEYGYWKARLEAETGNLHLALRYAAGRDADRGLRLAAAVATLWNELGWGAEAAHWLTSLLDRASPAPSASRARGLRLLGWLRRSALQSEGDVALYEQSLQISRQAGALVEQQWALHYLGRARLTAGETQAAISLFEEALAVCDAAGYPQGRPSNLNMLAWPATFAGDFDRARRLHEQALDESRRVQDMPGEAWALRCLANLMAAQGDPLRGLALAHSALDLSRRSNNRGEILVSLSVLGHRYEQMGDDVNACATARDRLDLARSIGNAGTVGGALMELARLLAAAGNDSEATARLNEAISVCLDAGLDSPVAVAMKELAAIHLSLGQLQEANEQLGQALALARKRDGPWLIADILDLQGDRALAAHDTMTALARYDEAKVIRSGCRHPNSERLYQHKAALAAQQDGDGQAATQFLTALFHLVTTGDHRRAPDAVARFADDLAALGFFELATCAYSRVFPIIRRHKDEVTDAALLESWAQAEARGGSAIRACALLAAADAWRTRLGLTLLPRHRKGHASAVAALQEQLGAGAFNTRWSAAQSLTPDQAVESALAEGG